MRRRPLWAACIAVGVLALVAAARSVVIVDQTEAVYVTEFGRPVRLIDEPGLHWKWPHQSRRGFDRRLQLDTPPPREMLTKDKKNLEVAWYVSWKIADVERFLNSVRTMPDASARLEDMAASVLAAELGGHDLAALVQGRRDLGARTRWMQAVTARIGEQAGKEYGLTVVDVRLRRLNYPEEVRSAVFEQIRSERQRVAAATRAEGESQARTIRSAADRERAARDRRGRGRRRPARSAKARPRPPGSPTTRTPPTPRSTSSSRPSKPTARPSTRRRRSSSRPTAPSCGCLTQGMPEPPAPPPSPAERPTSRRSEPRRRRRLASRGEISHEALDAAAARRRSSACSRYLATGLMAVLSRTRSGVVRRFGAVLREPWGPGLHWGLPWGLDRVDRIKPGQTRTLTVGAPRPRRRRPLARRPTPRATTS